jgi:hypothetical protein
LSLEEPLADEEKKKLRSILDNPRALDQVIDKALKGWGSHRTWRKAKIKSS